MAKDPEGKIGAITVKARIFKDTGIDITRYVSKFLDSGNLRISVGTGTGYGTRCAF
jgi:hypothetical protein